jgi:hypothetical protein
LAFYTREEQKISRSQRSLETISGFVGRPLYLGSILAFVSLWVLANIFARRFGLVEFDPAPYFWLQGIITLGALLTGVLATAAVVPGKTEAVGLLEGNAGQVVGMGLDIPAANTLTVFAAKFVM